VFFDHSFSFWQTFLYQTTEFSAVILLIYAATAYLLNYRIEVGALKTSKAINQKKQFDLIDKMIVSEANTKIALAVSDIIYISADSPYISISIKGKKYLHDSTLKSIALQLDPLKFVRVHKSYIINLDHLKLYKSRKNGDYDLVMMDNSEIRLSRNYFQEFKLIFKSESSAYANN
jgi:DNA-binding LytR/AlgR family response regulator